MPSRLLDEVQTRFGLQVRRFDKQVKYQVKEGRSFGGQDLRVVAGMEVGNNDMVGAEALMWRCSNTVL
jgi:hypothetical protein